MKIGIVGGTGREGKGLALRWVAAGHDVAIGSRDAERARSIAAELRESLPDGQRARLTGDGNAAIVADAELVVLSVPYGAHNATLTGLKDVLSGKTLVDITVPLKPPKVNHTTGVINRYQRRLKVVRICPKLTTGVVGSFIGIDHHACDIWVHGARRRTVCAVRHTNIGRGAIRRGRTSGKRAQPVVLASGVWSAHPRATGCARGKRVARGTRDWRASCLRSNAHRSAGPRAAAWIPCTASCRAAKKRRKNNFGE